MAIEFVLLALGAYLIGSVPSAYLAAKWSRGIDIRQYGSGNVGMSNLRGLTSMRLTIAVTIFDLVKGMIMIVVARLLGLDIAQQVTIGLAAIVGHNWPVFLRFNGGRGALSILGVALILPLLNNLIPWWIIAFLVIMIPAWFVFNNIPLGFLITFAILPLVSWGFHQPLPLTLCFVGMFAITVIRRLSAPRIAAIEPLSYRQLLINRLLFDRDIRDREAWVHRVPLPTGSTGQQEKQDKDKA